MQSLDIALQAYERYTNDLKWAKAYQKRGDYVQAKDWSKQAAKNYVHAVRMLTFDLMSLPYDCVGIRNRTWQEYINLDAWHYMAINRMVISAQKIINMAGTQDSEKWAKRVKENWEHDSRYHQIVRM